MTTTNLTATAIDNGLLSPSRNKWQGNTISFSIPGDQFYSSSEYGDSTKSKLEPTVGNGFLNLTAAQSANTAVAMSIWDSYIAPSMPQVGDNAKGSGDIRVAFTDLSKYTSAYAYGYAPGTTPIAGDIWIARENYFQDFTQGSYDFQALLHEIGHALGVKHPFDDPALTTGSGGENYNRYTYTIMSYTPSDYLKTFAITPSGGGNNIGFKVGVTTDATPMVLDIQAVQDLYGTDPTTGAGDDVYKFTDADFNSRRSIYDAGGTDTLDFSALSRASHIDLRQGAYSDIDYLSLADQEKADDAQLATLGLSPTDLKTQEDGVHNTLYDTKQPTYQWTSNLGIAFSTTIENVIGTSKADLIVGSTSGNVITGGGGADTITGGGGADVFKGTAAALNGDTITDFAGGDFIYITNAVSALPTLAYLNNILSFSLASDPATTYRMTVNGASGPVQQRADAAGGIDIYFQSAAPKPSYSIAVQANSINEGNAAPGNTLVYTVTRTAATDTASVNVAFSGTATGAGKAGADYTVMGLDASGLLTFAAGATTATFKVTTIPDKTSEANETVIATISNPTNGAVGTATATGTIVNDDGTTTSAPKALGFAYPTDHLNVGDTVNYSVSFNQAVFVAAGQVADAIAGADQTEGDFEFIPPGDLPALVLGNGKTATYVSGSGTNKLVFSHTVEAGETKSDLTPKTISNQGGSIGDAAGGVTAQTMDVGLGLGTANYEHAGAAVTANLGDPTQNTGDAAGDTYGGIEKLRGSNYDDTLTGDANRNVIEGGAGADIIRGGAGLNFASYAHSGAGVTVDLNLVNVAQTSAGDASGDRLSQIENLRGSTLADTLTGDGKANRLIGLGGADTLYGNGGADRLIISGQAGMLDGGNGKDSLLIGPGSDVTLTNANFRNIEYVSVNDGVSLDMSGVAHAPLAIHSRSADTGSSIIGTQRNDRILAGDGGDTIEGGKGKDVLFGGSGRDTFVESMANMGRDVIFNASLSMDTFDVSSFASEGHLHFADFHGNGDTLIYGDGGPSGASFVIKGVNAADAQANGHFIYGHTSA